MFLLKSGVVTLDGGKGGGSVSQFFFSVGGQKKKYLTEYRQVTRRSGSRDLLWDAPASGRCCGGSVSVRNDGPSSCLRFRGSDVLHYGSEALHGAGYWPAAGRRFGQSRHPGAAEREAGDGWRRGSRKENGPSGRRAAASDATGFSAQPVGHGLPDAHEPAPGSPGHHRQRSVLPQRLSGASCSRPAGFL